MTTASGASDIRIWLEQTGLGKYAELFEANEIDLGIVGELTNEDLKDLEIPLGDRKRLLKAIAKLHGMEPGSPGKAANTAMERAAPGVERRQVTIMFCDLVGSTELSSRHDPEDVADVMREFQTCCAELIKSRGGYVARYQGDAVLAYFGWPRTFGDDAERCVRAGLELVATIGRMTAADGAPISARVGIATGLVMVGELIGEGVAQEEAVVGATPNLAARLESMASPGTVVIGDTTRKLIGDYFDLADLGEHALKGFSEPMRAWRVERESPATSRFAARLNQGLTPLVGRKGESARLGDLWARADEGCGEVALIVGEAGIGKSRLVQTLSERDASAAKGTVLYQCSSFHANSTLHPVIENIARAADIELKDTAEEKLDKLETWLTTRGVVPADAVPLLATVLSVPFEDRYAALNLSPQSQRDRLIELASTLILDPGKRHTTLLVFEDVHWADPTTLDVLAELFDRIPSERVLLVITCRPEFEPDWPQRNAVHTFDLRRLARPSVQAMIKRILGDKALPEEIFDSIVSTTDGVPLFVEELTRAIVESGQLEEFDDRYELRDQRLQLSIPATLRGSLAARLDQLAIGKEVAQVGATIGRVFTPELAGFILRKSELELREPLQHLIDAGIIERQGGAARPQYSFKHALIQEVAYRSQLKARRREVHLQIANALEFHFSDVAERQPEILAHHFAGAGSLTTAADYLLRASAKALRVAATGEAIAHLKEGLSLVEQLPPSDARDLAALRFHASMGTAYMHEKGWAAAEVEDAYATANELSHAATNAAEAVWILWGIWVHRLVRGRIDEALVLTDRIRKAANRYDDPSAHLVAEMITLQTSFYQGRFDDAVKQCVSVESSFVPERDRPLIEHYSTDLQLVALVHRSIASWVIGQFDRCMDIAAEAEQLARSLEHPYSISWVLIWGSTPQILRGDFADLGPRLSEGIAIARDQGFAYLAAMGEFFEGLILARRGDYGPGIEHMTTGLDAFMATGAEIAVPYFRTLLAEMLGASGRIGDAFERLQEAENQIERWGECWQAAEVHRVHGDLHAEHGEIETAASSYRRAIEIARRQGATGWWLRASTGLAKVLAEQGKTGEAETTLQPPFQRLDEGRSTPDYRAAEDLMARLSGTPTALRN